MPIRPFLRGHNRRQPLKLRDVVVPHPTLHFPSFDACRHCCVAAALGPEEFDSDFNLGQDFFSTQLRASILALEMDPLSVAASAIAIGQAASAVAMGVRALKSFSNGPVEFSELLTDLSSFEVVLEITRASVEAMQALGPNMPAQSQSFVGLQALHRELTQCTENIDSLAKRMIAASGGVNKKGQHRIPRVRWLREKDNVAKLRQGSTASACTLHMPRRRQHHTGVRTSFHGVLDRES